MNQIKARIDMNKAFGVKVLLKLAAHTQEGLIISDHENGISSNVGMDKLNDAVDKTIRQHNIALKPG